ncbi:HAD-like domain-containing protein [Lipomyces japonicus]|uniref:HAD-like domain-containing protein n=1 Tax=Lipomyces japonicus TaxID=56871 RepID=UPI0034CECA45
MTEFRPQVLFVDWDETITEVDTMHLVAAAAYATKPDFKPEWNYFGNEYLKDYNNYVQKFGKRNNLVDELRFLDGLTEVELTSVRRVERSGLFKGITKNALLKQASNVKIRPGWWDVVKNCKKLGILIVIVSVNWSQLLIQEVFNQHGFGDVPVYANEVHFDSDGLASGLLSKHEYELRTGADKSRLIDHVLTKLGVKNEVVYAGDSTSDLRPLLQARLGLIVGQKTSLREACARGGVNVVDIRKWDRRVSEGQKVLYSVTEWSELNNALTG